MTPHLIEDPFVTLQDHLMKTYFERSSIAKLTEIRETINLIIRKKRSSKCMETNL